MVKFTTYKQLFTHQKSCLVSIYLPVLKYFINLFNLILYWKICNKSQAKEIPRLKNSLKVNPGDIAKPL